MFTIQLDQAEIEDLFLEELKKRLDEIQHQYTFWDMKTLCEQTKMSENNIKEKFFYDSRFPKYKVGGKWLMPAKEAKQFLLQWLKEQPTH
jgi:hypothetical protein